MEDRYSRQVLFDGIGRAGQERLASSRVCIIGCGALGTIHAQTLSRAGVGHIRLVDRDFVEISNLQRQILFEEGDEGLPKAVAAARRIQRINSEVEAEPMIKDVNFENVEQIISGSDLVLDGTDNFEARFLINDACAKLNIPWIYGAAVGSEGTTMTIIPGRGPCLRCLIPQIPEPGSGLTCDTAGVIMPIISAIGSIQAAEAIKLLTGQLDKLHRSIIHMDVWDFRLTRIDISDVDRSGCRTCNGQYDFLLGRNRQQVAVLCGRDAVQVIGSGPGEVDLARLAERLSRLGQVTLNDYLLRFKVEGYEITVFRDARSIIRGTSDPMVARNLYARYIGA
jgi:adenylyltransferase/sulfurtransferase